MTEPVIVIDSGILAIPIGIQSKDDPDKITNTALHFDMTDKGLTELQAKQATVKKELDQLGTDYDAKLGKIDENNLSEAIKGLSEIMQIQFDSMFGSGEYDRISKIGGGNSFINMWLLFNAANDYIGKKLDEKASKLQKKSENRKAKILAAHKRK
jgi:hypothetical protein